MITVTIKKDTTGLDKIDALFPAAVTATTYSIAEKIFDTIQSSWSGYSPPPSAPGETPHIETETLKDSIRIEQKRDLGKFASGWVLLFDTEYAAALEFGYSPRNLLPRPYIKPAIDKVAQDVGDFFTHSLDFV